MTSQLLFLIFIALLYLPYPINIFCWLRGKYLGHDTPDVDTEVLLSIMLLGLIPTYSWAIFFDIKYLLISNEKIEKQKAEIQLKNNREKYLKAYLESQGHSLEDMDEWINSLGIIEQFINKW